ncbi:MAG: hypothetical protein WBL63_23795 [Candidatus Acidiferrum sp.]
MKDDMDEPVDNPPAPPADVVPAPAPARPAELSFSQFLVSKPSNVQAHVTGLFELQARGLGVSLAGPEIRLHCDGEGCAGERRFACTSGAYLFARTAELRFLSYACKDCGKSPKTFALEIIRDKAPTSGWVTKLGEMPPFGTHTPRRICDLIGEDYRELFLQGRRAENAGLGIGAYAYYRRIVEDQKGKFIDEIRKVAERLGASDETIKDFQEAAKEKQFKNAVEKIKLAIPPSLLINGRNPLLLLHDALSEGIHEYTDAQCLELAATIRLILTDLSEKISMALKEKAQLKEAVEKLLYQRLGH